MPTRAEIIAEARTWLRTPYHHLGRLKGVGVDCVGVVLGLMEFCGAKPDPTAWTYNRFAENKQIEPEMAKALTPIPLHAMEPGDVLSFWIRHPDRVIHCGILTPYGLLHTHGGVGKVVEHGLDARWRERLSSAFQLPGVTD